MSAENIKTEKYHDGTWIAWNHDQFDGDPADIGRGDTEEAAISDLKERLK